MNDLQKVLNERKRRQENNKPIEPPKLLTVKEAAEYLKVTGTTIHNLKNSGKIKFRKIGGSIRFTYEDLNVYFFHINTNMAICNKGFIWIDNKTNEILPFEYEELYKVVYENKIWIYLYNDRWGKRIRFGKKEFRKYFSIAEDWQIMADKYNLGKRNFYIQP